MLLYGVYLFIDKRAPLRGYIPNQSTPAYVAVYSNINITKKSNKSVPPTKRKWIIFYYKYIILKGLSSMYNIAYVKVTKSSNFLLKITIIY
jgi:hypothetical protein